MAGKPVGITDGPAGLKLDVPALTYAIYRVMK
jgi:hypothetical protein